jgi:hypothetical protein
MLASRVASRWLLGKQPQISDTERPEPENSARTLSEDPLFEKFLGEKYQGGNAKIQNPNPDTREKWPTISFQTALKDASFRKKLSEEFQRWKGSREENESDETPRRTDEERAQAKRPARQGWGSREEQDDLLDMARHGRMVDDDAIAKKSANVTRKRTLQMGDKEGDFIWKPSFGEDLLRIGIEPGTYHQREAATYNVDRLFGDDVVVPPTMTTGNGSYQAWAEGANSLAREGGSLERISNRDLVRNRSFQRLLVLDAILGHEDRHGNNVMFRWNGPEDDPNNLHFDAIDNGLSLASPEGKTSPDDYVVESPWAYMAEDPSSSVGVDRQRAVSDVLSEVGPELHDQLRGIKIEDFVRAMTSTGLRDERAIMAAAVRLVALQEDAFALGEVIRENQGNTRKGVATFLHLSGTDPKKLLGYARAEHRLPDIEKAVREAMAT